MQVNKKLCSLLCALAFPVATLMPLAAHAETCTPPFAASHLVTPGELQMSTNPTLPPQQFVNANGELEGLNVELGKAVAVLLCLKPVFVRMDMPSMTPALRSGRFDMINTGMFYTDERSKLFYMVPYGEQAISIYTLPNSKLVIHSIDDLAGHTVGVETATYQEKKARAMNDDMVKRGLKSINFLTFETASETLAAMRAGQLEAGINIDETARDLADRKLAKVWVSGMAGTDITLDFRDKAVADAAVKALDTLKANGTYDKLFAKFKMTPLKDVKTFSIRGTGPT
jgi:polar amino acid transport system substrate-binding protein